MPARWRGRGGSMREIDEQIARALGLNPEMHHGSMLCFWDADEWFIVPYYTEDDEVARQLEDEIERRGLQETYVEYLIARVIPTRSDWDAHSAWALIRATPEQRARAFLEAVSDRTK